VRRPPRTPCGQVQRSPATSRAQYLALARESPAPRLPGVPPSIH